MSAELLVYLRRERLPTTRQWNDALRKRGFKVVLDPGCDPSTHDGYFPARALGEEAGFEYLFTTPEQGDPGHDAGVMMSFRSDAELASAAAAGAVLAEMAQGVLYDPQDGKRYAPADALEYAASCVGSLAAQLASRAASGKTPAAWATLCRPILASVHPAYKEKRRSKGKRLEYLREDESGLLISHNFQIDHHANVQHGFALLFVELDTRTLFSPLRTHGWFDGRAVSDRHWDHFAKAVPSRLLPPKAIHLSRRIQWSDDEAHLRHYPNPPDIPGFVAESVAYAERHLLPYFRATLARGRRNLVDLYALAHGTFADPATRESLLAQARSDPDIVRRSETEAHAIAYARTRREGIPFDSLGTIDNVDNASAFHVAHPWRAVKASDPKLVRFAFLTRWADHFMAARDRLGHARNVAEKLTAWDEPGRPPPASGWLKRLFGG